MNYVITSFDYDANPIKPLISLALVDGNIKILPIFHKASKITLMEAENNLKILRFILENTTATCNDFKNHISSLKLDLDRNYDIYDSCLNIDHSHSINRSKKILAEAIIKSKESKFKWSKLVAEASIVYQYMEEKGFDNKLEIIHPSYCLNTFSGRSKCKGFNIQGGSKDDIILPADSTKNIFIQFDWISADIRAASLLSNDQEMINSFENEDPYSILAEVLGKSRKEAKLSFLKAINSLSYEDPIMYCFEKFQKWASESIKSIKNGNPGYNLIGRPYVKDSSHGDKSVFNAQMQGTVAQAMQAVLTKLYKLDKSTIFTEIHDSLICICEKNNIKNVINEVSNIMLYPFDGILDDNPKFPLKVNIGTKWRKWKLVKVFR